MAQTLRVGLLNDLSAGPPGPSDMESWLRRTVDESIRIGRIDFDVEFVNAWGLGLPSGSAEAVTRAFKALVDQEVLLVVGPAIGDNALAVAPLVEQYRVPTINWAGAERARGEYMFHLQVGSHEDESILLARHFAALGVRNVGVVYDQSPIGTRHLQFLQSEARILGFSIANTAPISPLAEEATVDVAQALSGVDAIAYLGLGISASAVAQALVAGDWRGPRAMNTAGLRGYAPEFARAIDGWVYVDMHSDHNKTLLALCARWNVPVQRRLAAAKGFDLGRLIVEGLARAPERTRDGVKEGLERVKWLPAAEGEEGTLLGFGRFDRGALHGRYLVLRRWVDGGSLEISAER